MIKKESIIFLADSIGEIVSFYKLNEWFQNIIYKIESKKGEYCLRISKRNSREHVQYEIDILRSLKNLPVIQLHSVDDDYIFSVDGKTAILYEYIDGTINLDNTIQELYLAGKFLGDFHIQASHIPYSRHRFEFYDLPDETIQKYIQCIDDSGLSYRELLPEILSELKENNLSDALLSWPIHVDFGPKNVLWKDGKIAAVLDFDNAYRGPYILDIWKSIMFFASSHWEFHLPKARAFFEGYVSKRSLTYNEKGEIYKAIKYAFLSHVFVDYYMFAKQVTTEEYFHYIVKDLYISYNSFVTQLRLNPDFLRAESTLI